MVHFLNLNSFFNKSRGQPTKPNKSDEESPAQTMTTTFASPIQWEKHPCMYKNQFEKEIAPKSKWTVC